MIDWDKIVRDRANTPAARPPAGVTIAPEIQQVIDDVQPAVQISLDIPSNNRVYQPAHADGSTQSDSPGSSAVSSPGNTGPDGPAGPTRQNLVVEGVLYKWDTETGSWHPIAWDGTPSDQASTVDNKYNPISLGNGTSLHSDGSIRDEKGHFASSTGARVGASAESNVWDHLETEGLTVVRRTVVVQGNGGKRRDYDGAIDLGDGSYLGIEVKSGGASRDERQRSFDDWVRQGNVATGVGRSAGFSIVGVFDAITP